MNWKSTAIVTGATALVGWFASPHERTPAPSLAVAPARAAQEATVSDIEQQAARLQARLRAESAYRQPSRDPFRFDEGRAEARARASVEEIPETSVAPAVPPGPQLRLSGVATDIVDGVPQRTAILSAPDGVLLVREGDAVGGVFRVSKIDEEAIDLVSGDGQLLHLRLSATRP